MRTTLTIEPTLAEQIHRMAASRGSSMKEIVNEALREGLKALEKSSSVAPPKFVVEPHNFRVKPGIDLDRIGQLADELEDEYTVAKLRKRKRSSGT
jgi:hypothetical protein